MISHFYFLSFFAVVGIFLPTTLAKAKTQTQNTEYQGFYVWVFAFAYDVGEKTPTSAGLTTATNISYLIFYISYLLPLKFRSKMKFDIWIILNIHPQNPV